MFVNLGFFRCNRRANVSVEMALISVFFLFPVIAGSADFLQLVADRAQLSGVLPSLFGFAWNNPDSATDTTQLANILSSFNNHSGSMVTFPDGKFDSSTTYRPTLSYICTVLSTNVQLVQTSPCPVADAQQEFVTYEVATQVSVPIPIPFALPNPYQLTAAGQVQIQ